MWSATTRRSGSACRRTPRPATRAATSAHAITAALQTEPGNPVQVGDLIKDGPRLQDLIDTGKPIEIKVHEGFEYWVGENVEDPTGEVAAGLERANAAAAPTVRLESVEAAYWTQIGDRIGTCAGSCRTPRTRCSTRSPGCTPPVRPR